VLRVVTDIASESEDGEFHVCQYFTDGTHQYARRFVNAAAAVLILHHCTESLPAKAGKLTRVTIAHDNGDVVVDWVVAKGPHDEGVKKP
jgi:hypothetical protein